MGLAPATANATNLRHKVDKQSVIGALKATGSRDPDVLHAAKMQLYGSLRMFRTIETGYADCLAATARWNRRTAAGGVSILSSRASCSSSLPRQPSQHALSRDRVMHSRAIAPHPRSDPPDASSCVPTTAAWRARRS